MTEAITEPVAPVEAPGRRERRAAETRAAILGAARVLFDERGYAQTTVDDIAERADIAPRTFFRYFPTKEAVLFAAADEIRVAMLAELAARPLDEPPLRSLLVAVRRVLPLVEARRAAIQWAFGLLRQQYDAGVDPGAVKARTAAELSALVAERMGVDVDADPRPSAWTGVVLACFGATMRATMGVAAAAAAHRSFEDVFVELLSTTSAELAAAIAAAIDAALDDVPPQGAIAD